MSRKFLNKIFCTILLSCVLSMAHNFYRQRDDFVGTIDFEKIQSVEKVKIHYFNNSNSLVYPPSSISIMASEDGNTFLELATIKTVTVSGMGAQTLKLKFSPGKIRLLKIHVKNSGLISKGNPGEGSPAWLFIDEVEVE